MVNKKQDTEKPLGKSKLLKLKEWLTVPEAARYLSTIFGEEVGEADVLQLALEGHLRLSVLFVNGAHATPIGKLMPFEEWEERIRGEASLETMDIEIDPRERIYLSIPGSESALFRSHSDTNKSGLLFSLFRHDKERFIELFWSVLTPEIRCKILSRLIDLAMINGKRESEKSGGYTIYRLKYTEGEPESIDGVWDLPMIGAERRGVEHEYYRLTNGPGVSVDHPYGQLVMNPDKEVWQIKVVRFGQNPADLNEVKSVPMIDDIKDNIRELISADIQDMEQTKVEEERVIPGSIMWRAAIFLPDDVLLVVRTNALREFEKLISNQNREELKSPSIRQEKSDLHIIGAMLWIIIKSKLFASEEKLRHYIADQYRGYTGCAERTLADRFKKAKDMLGLSDSSD